jgi:hypothetical protein
MEVDKMVDIQIIIKDNENYDLILNKTLSVADYELANELIYRIREDINHMIHRYHGLIKEE